jgi:hypothetical protein
MPDLAKAPPAPAPPVAPPSSDPEFSPWPPEAKEAELARTPEEPAAPVQGNPPSRYTLSRIKSLPMSLRHDPLPAVRIEDPEPAIARPTKKPEATVPMGEDAPESPDDGPKDGESD